MKTIYILLTKSDTILSRLVHLVTSDTYTHVSVSFDRQLGILYSSSRKNGQTLFPAGPCTERLNAGYYERHGQIPCRLYELRVSDEAYGKAAEEVREIMKHERNYHFNILGLFLCQMKIPFHRKHHFFCSQFVGEILRRSRAVEIPKDTTLMRPSDYTRMPELTLLYQGRVGELALMQGSAGMVFCPAA